MNNLPPIPSIEGDLMLDVFKHHSVRDLLPEDIGDQAEAEYGDTDRVAALGEAVFTMVVTSIAFQKRPPLELNQMQAERQRWLSDDAIMNWVSLYRLRAKVSATREARGQLENPEETRFLFNSYVGAVYHQKGIQEVYSWVSRLIEPNEEPRKLPGTAASKPPGTQAAAPADYPMGPPPGATPPPQSVPRLAYFNQVTTQMGYSVQWAAESTGPPHMPRWTVRCIVNGAERGVGEGRSQKLAKEVAAQQAATAMGL